MNRPPRPLSKTRPASRLVQHDIHLTRAPGDAPAQVDASVMCERRACMMSVDECARCERFARIEPHEAGYVLLCRAHDEESPAEGEDTEAADS